MPKYNSTRQQFNARLRDSILQRDKDICRYCYEPATEVDHVIPIARGGTNERSNLVASCRSCNAIARDCLFLSFEDKRAYILSFPPRECPTQRKTRAERQDARKRCADCREEFLPLYAGATLVLCAECKTKDDESALPDMLTSPTTAEFDAVD